MSSSRRARGRLERIDRLLRGQVPARLGVQLAPFERRLTEEEVDVLCQLGQPVARAGIARVRQHARLVRDPEAERDEVVVGQADRGQLEPGSLEQRALVVLAQLERALEHPRRLHPFAERLELLDAAARQPQLRLRQLAGEEHAPPRPRCEIAPVVEVEVRDRDRFDVRPATVELPEPREDAGPAVEQELPLAPVDQVPGLSSAGVRPSRGAAHDCQFHRHILAQPWQGRSEW